MSNLRVGKRPVIAARSRAFPIGEAIRSRLTDAPGGMFSPNLAVAYHQLTKQAWMPEFLPNACGQVEALLFFQSCDAESRQIAFLRGNDGLFRLHDFEDLLIDFRAD